MLTILSSFSLIFLAEMGDKSQLVCMLLASRYRALPVILGASVAFSLLNALAVTVGSALSLVIPAPVMAAFVALLFFAFGCKTLFEKVEEDGDIKEKSGHNLFLTAFLMIFIAEFGDKTQLAVAALGASSNPIEVYVGATAALIATSILGALSGKWLTQFISPAILHRVGGLLFIGFAVAVVVKAFIF